MKTRITGILNSALLVASCIIGMSLHAPAAHAQQMNFYGNYSNVSNQHSDKSKPVSSGRSYFTSNAEQISGGAKLTLEMWHGSKNEPVSVWLQVAINDGKGNVEAIPILQLDDNKKDNKTNYYSKREYKLDYKELNAKLKKLLPADAKHMTIGPGSPLLVLAKWTSYSHSWGGLGRGGIVYMPEDPKAAPAATAKSGKTRRATELDLGYEIGNLMAFKYNELKRGKQVGLEIGGQIKSRLEKEGKYQIPLNDMDTIKTTLYKLANDPKEAKRVLGSQWTIVPELRYMKKDKAGNIKYDKNGHPTPDPMVDTYYDSKDSIGAQNDIALRYRWTEGNGTGSWNFKPGLTNTSPDGIVNRLEYAIDTTDDKPSTIETFADSMDPLNPLKMIRDIVPGSKPSDFLLPSLKITDTRHKFKLEHKSGLVIEVSLDDVEALSLRNNAKARYGQLEMDVDHPSTQSANVASGPSQSAGLQSDLDDSMKQFLKKLKGGSFLDGRPVMHTMDDLDPKSPINKKHDKDFAMAEDIIKVLRNETAGKDWIPAPQKASLAAVLLGHFDRAKASKSVKDMIDEVKVLKLKNKDPGPMFEDLKGKAGAACRVIFK